MHVDHAVFLARIQLGLGFFYLLLAAMNWVAALLLWRDGPKPYFKLGGLTVTNVFTWLFVGGLFLIVAPFAMMGSPPEFSESVKHVINELSGPVTLTVGSLVGMAFLFFFRGWWTKPPIAWLLLNLSLLAMGLAVTDANFFEIVGKPDNVPIVGLVYLLGFFTWLATYKAVINDDRMAQGLPKHGYTRVVENILDHPRVQVTLATPWDAAMQREFAHVFHSGAIDACFGFSEGRLGYRSMHWQRGVHDGDYQGTAIINCPTLDVPWTRVLEHRHLSPWASCERSLVTHEFSKETEAGDLPFYPKRLAADRELLARYVARVEAQRNMTFIGRLGTYRYLDMHQVIADALDLARDWCAAHARGAPRPLFSRPPL